MFPFPTPRMLIHTLIWMKGMLPFSEAMNIVQENRPFSPSRVQFRGNKDRLAVFLPSLEEVIGVGFHGNVWKKNIEISILGSLEGVLSSLKVNFKR